MKKKLIPSHDSPDRAAPTIPENRLVDLPRAGQPVTENKSIDGTSSNLLDLEDRERIERMWAERAAQMAKVLTGTENQGEQVTVALIRLGRELLGLEAQFIFDIHPREAITRVPRVPGWVVGVTNLRGNILSVVDLRKYFGLPGEPINNGEEKPGALVFVHSQSNKQHPQHGPMEIIFLVDDVISVETLSVRQSVTDSGLIHSLRPEYIRSIAERKVGAGAAAGDILAQRHVVILDVEALLGDPRLIIHEEIA